MTIKKKEYELYLLEKIVAKITSWTARKLSYAGRLQLIQVVLFSIQAYWSQLFHISTKVLKLIEAHCRSFLWSGTNSSTKRSLVAQDKICTPKSLGGLNLINVRLWYTTKIAKTTWDLANKQGKLWIKWIHTYYIKTTIIFTTSIPSQASWMVRKSIAARSTLNQTQTEYQNSMCIKIIYQKLLGKSSRVT